MSIFNGTADDIFNKKTDYPIGSICMFNTNIDPNEMYGGTWVRIKGKFILGADDDTYPLGSEGGEAEHILTIDEMPSHSHSDLISSAVNTSAGAALNYENVEFSGQLLRVNNDTYTIKVSSDIGNSQPHNNMPPYVAFYIWAKVA